MSLYEHVFLARQDISQQQVDQLIENYKSVITAHGGNVVRIESWGLRPLAYRIRKNRKAYYILMNIDASPAAIAEMEHQMRINEDILRFMAIRVDEHEEGPSAMLSRREKDERYSREDRPNREEGNSRPSLALQGDSQSKGEE